MNTRTQNAARTATIMTQHGFEAEVIGNRVAVSLKNRRVDTMEVMTVINNEQLKISRNNVNANLANGVVITI